MSNQNCLPEIGFVRLPSIIRPNGPIPVGRSTWWEGVRSGAVSKAGQAGTAHHSMAC